MHTTSRLGLDVPDSTDAVSGFPTVAGQQMGILDNAVIYEENTLVNRPVASSTAHGTLFRTTDTNGETLGWNDGAVWLPLGLIPASVSTNTTALSGQAIITTGSSAVTVTLPTNTKGAMVAVMNRSTGGTTVSGSNIQGTGLSSASSFPLGTVGASAVLLADGTNWNIIAGQQDTGWVALTPGTSITASTSPVAAARLVGDKVYYRGSLTTATSFAGPNVLLATIAAGATATALTPSYAGNFTAPTQVSSTYSNVSLDIFNSTGLNIYAIGALASGVGINLAPLFYSQ